MLNNLEVPVGYGNINLYNAQFSPSTVHVKNTALQRNFRFQVAAPGRMGRRLFQVHTLWTGIYCGP